MLNINFFVVILFLIVLQVCKGQGISKDLYRCRQMCYAKYIQTWHHCMDYQDCKNCWKSCDEALGPFPLSVTSASKQGSMVLADIAWDPNITNTSKQCLVTWEVSGGGLMGNLLTDGSTVELSLWADTIYHIQVTCKRKETDKTRKSLKLIVDTRKLNLGTSASSSFLPSLSPSSSLLSSSDLSGNVKKLENVYLPDLSVKNTQADDIEHIFKENSYKVINPENSINHISSVMFSKLEIKKRNLSDIMHSKNIMYTVFASFSVGLMILLLIILIFIFRRSRRNFKIDKQKLVNSEFSQNDNRILHV